MEFLLEIFRELGWFVRRRKRKQQPDEPDHKR
jgi:hypothetical protein